MDLELTDKVAVITGGSAGIGRAVAEGLAAEGVHVALCARDAEATDAVAQHLREQFGVEALSVQADVTAPDDLNRLVRAVEDAFGGADLLINNAGIGTDETILDAPDAKWQYVWTCT